MNGELLAALERIEREKGIDKDVLFSAIESALVSAARKVIDDPDIPREEISVSIDKETGEIEVFSEGEEVQSERFGRIAAQTAKQVIIQKIREAERDVVHEKYSKKIGTIISGAVHRFEKGNVVVELDDAEAILPKQQQIGHEKFRQGEQVRAFLSRVDRGSGAPEIVLSRTEAGFVKKLFELEVPEISSGIVEIKAIAREPGERTKIAVCSKDEKVDPVGACVGMRGSRVRDIVKELHGERIDIVRWDDDIREYLPAAVNPAEISKMAIDRDNKTIKVTVPKDQLALLIGKKGRNIRLASKLVGWELIADSLESDTGIKLEDIPGIGKKTLAILKESGFGTLSKLENVEVDDLSELKGIGKKTAEKIIAIRDEHIGLKEDGSAEDEKVDIFKAIADDSEQEIDPDVFQEKIEKVSREDNENRSEDKDEDEKID